MTGAKQVKEIKGVCTGKHGKHTFTSPRTLQLSQAILLGAVEAMLATAQITSETQKGFNHVLLEDLETFVSEAGNLALGVLHDGDQPIAAHDSYG